MEGCRVVILYNHELFANVIARLLRTRGFCSAAMDGRTANAIREARAMRPRIMIVEDDGSDRAFVARLAEILEGIPDIVVIRVSIHNNRMGIYSSKQIIASTPEDLFQIIDSLVGCQSMSEGAMC